MRLFERIFWITNFAIKLGLVLLLLHAVLYPDLPQYAAKGIGSRLVFYPLGVVIVPLIWWVANRHQARRNRSSFAYPLTADILISAPFMIDTLGNALNLFNTIEWWDDLMHFTQWLLLLGGIGTLLVNKVKPRWAMMLLIASLGSYIAILWEVAEYWAFVRTSPELQTAYTDTLGDLILGSLGSTLAGALLLLSDRYCNKHAA